MALITFAYLKCVKKNQQTFSPGSPVTSTVISRDVEVLGIPAISGVAAPSTFIIDRNSGVQYYCNKPFSAYLSAATAATSDATAIVIV